MPVEKVPTQQASPPQTDAKALLQAAARACSQVNTIKYAFEQEAVGGAQGAPHTSATVRQARAQVPVSGYMPGKYQVVGWLARPDKQREEFAYAYDGSSFRLMDSVAKVVLVVNAPSPNAVGRMLGPEKGLLGFPAFTHAEPFKDIIERAERFAYEGVVEVGGVPCHVVAVTTTYDHPGIPKTSFTSRWFIGVKDNLPRRLEAGGSRLSARVLEVNQPADETQFVLNVPQGYGEKLVTGNEPLGKGLLAVGALAPVWALPDARGRTHALSDYRGKIVVMDFWGTWCVPCRKSMPHIQALHEAFKDKGVVVFGVAVGDGEGDPVGYMKRYRYTYGLLLKGDAVAKLYAAVVMPTLYVIGPDGKVLHAEFGYRENVRAELGELIEKELKAGGR
ncbi:MAG TPA: redoxin domain-containing protein [Pyrinomonadaceae bacterium]|nr:redoxin domain-containing protein [Pyrinomonadaceae bacterium]